MKKRTVLAALAAIAAAALVLPSSPAQAQDGTNLYIVHGLDLGLEDDTLVTVCADGTALFEFSYGDVEEVPGAQGTLDVSVHPGSDPGCDEDPVIGPDGFTPEGAAQAVVATFVGVEGEEAVLGLAVFDLDAECNTAGEGGLTALHATALVPPVFPGVDGVVLPDALEFGDSLFAALPADSYDVGLYLDPEDETPAAGLEVTLPEGVNTVLAAVGDPDPEVDTLAVIEFPVPVGVCDAPGPDPTPDDPTPTPDGPTPTPATPTPVPASERPLALTG